jgi:hypothetical protein
MPLGGIGIQAASVGGLSLERYDVIHHHVKGMQMSRLIQLISVLGMTTAACATTSSGAKPHDMSAAQHEREAQAHAGTGQGHADEYDPEARAEKKQCGPAGSHGPGLCWTSIENPTAQHRRAADEHRRHAAEHRAASTALRDAEARACTGIAPDDRDISPFDHTEDIAAIEPLVGRIGSRQTDTSERLLGAVVTFRAVPGMTAEWLQRVVDCHLARNASLGHEVPEMPNCPLVPRGAQARVRSTGDGFAVEIRSDDEATAREILARAKRLRPEAVVGAVVK